MRNLLFVLLFSYLPIALNAQLDDLLKNPDVSYVATFETEHDFRLSSKRETSDLQLLKFDYQNKGCADFRNDNWLARWLLQGMKNGIYRAYESIDLSVIVTHTTLLNKITTIDTVITFDPDTYEETMRVIKNELNPDDIKSFRTLQAIYYHKKTGNFQTRLLAIAPMVDITDPQGNVNGKMPLAWLAMDGKLADGLSVQSPDVAWAALLLDRVNTLKISELKLKKNEMKKTFAEQLFQEAISMKHPVESSEGYGCKNMLTRKEIDAMTNSIDTVITFDPETYKETMQIGKSEYTTAKLKQVLLAQEWYYDGSRHLIATKLKAIAPMVDVYDDKNTFMYSRRQYYLHF